MTGQSGFAGPCVSGPRLRELVAHLAEQARQRLGARDDREEVRIGAQRGTTCWCRCAAIPAPAIAPWFMPMLNPSQCEVIVRTRIAVWVSRRLVDLGGRRLVIPRDVPERHHEQVAGVVREEIEDDVRRLPAMHDERLLVAQRRRRAETHSSPGGGAAAARCTRCGAASRAAGTRRGCRRTGRRARRSGYSVPS